MALREQRDVGVTSAKRDGEAQFQRHRRSPRMEIERLLPARPRGSRLLLMLWVLGCRGHQAASRGLQSRSENQDASSSASRLVCGPLPPSNLPQVHSFISHGSCALSQDWAENLLSVSFQSFPHMHVVGMILPSP